MRRAVVLFAVGLLVLGLNAGAYADIFNIFDGGWSITLDTERQIRDGEGTLTDGLVNWKDPSGYDYLYQDTWFGRSGDATSEGPLSTLTLLSYSTPAPNKVLLSFKDPYSLYVDLSYELHGSGFSSWISESATLTNAGTGALTASIFKYADFDLCYGYDAHDNDYAFGNTSGITQCDAFSVANIALTSYAADAFQISTCGYPGSVISSLNDNNITNLNNTGSPYGPGDADFGFQWNLVLAPDESYTIENIKTLTTAPEPVSMILFLSGGAVLALRKFRKK